MGSAQWENTKRAHALLMGRWADFFAWLLSQPEAAEFADTLGERVDDAALDVAPGFCPLHGGDSGEAWRFFDDAWLNGGSICNSCGPSGSGVQLLEKLLGPDTAMAIVERYVRLRKLIEPAPNSIQRLWDWHIATHPYIAVNYLRARGLDVTTRTLPWTIRGARRMRCRGPKGEDYGQRPMVLSLLMSAEGHPLSYQQIALGEDHEKATDVPAEHVKRTAGIGVRRAFSSAFVELGAAQAETLLAMEGMETGLAMRQAFTKAGETPMVRASLGGGAASILNMVVPEGVRRVIIGADRDQYEQFFELAERRGGTLFRSGVDVRVACPSDDGNAKRDFLDMLVEEGDEAVFQALVDARPLQGVFQEASRHSQPPPGLPAPSTGHPGAEQAHGEEARALLPGKQRDIPQMLDRGDYSALELYSIFDAAILASPPSYWFAHEGKIVEVHHGSVLCEPSMHAVAAALDEKFTFCRGKQFDHSSNNVTRKWWERPELHEKLLKVLPRLDGVIARPTPVVSTCGVEGRRVLRLRVIDRPGMDTERHLMLRLDNREAELWDRADPNRLVDGEAVPNRRTAAWLLARQIIEDLFEDFPFDSAADRANAVAALFTPMLAHACGTVPFILADAPNPGSGKTTLVRTIAAPVGGLADVEYTGAEDELGKRLGSAFLTGRPLILLDNLTGRIDSDVLKRLITAPRETAIRVLGGNQLVYAPAGLVVFGTANNPDIQEEVARRTLLIRLNPRMENPELRRDFRRLNLVEWASGPVGETLRQSLYTIIRAWLADGGLVLESPVPFTGFERWGRLSYSLLRYIGLPEADDFLGNRVERLANADSRHDETHAFVLAWYGAFGEEAKSVAELRDLAVEKGLLSEVSAPASTEAQIKAMRGWLSRMADRVVGGITIQRGARTRHVRVTYQLARDAS